MEGDYNREIQESMQENLEEGNDFKAMDLTLKNDGKTIYKEECAEVKSVSIADVQQISSKRVDALKKEKLAVDTTTASKAPSNILDGPAIRGMTNGKSNNYMDVRNVPYSSSMKKSSALSIIGSESDYDDDKPFAKFPVIDTDAAHTEKRLVDKNLKLGTAAKSLSDDKEITVQMLPLPIFCGNNNSNVPSFVITSIQGNYLKHYDPPSPPSASRKRAHDVEDVAASLNIGAFNKMEDKLEASKAKNNDDTVPPITIEKAFGTYSIGQDDKQ